MRNKFTWLVIITVLLAGRTIAQEIPREIEATVVLQPMLQLNVDPNVQVEFGLLEVNEELYHVTKKPEDVLFSIESTTNWNLSVSADQPYFSGTKHPEYKIPVEFVGYSIENLGTNWDNGSFSNIINTSKDTIVELTPEQKQILSNGRRNNMGDKDMNSFIIHWKLLFENNKLRMKNYSHYFLEDERFKVNVNLTLSETLCENCY
jgi:hypothetical protein